jgi:hypothetical protein
MNPRDRLLEKLAGLPPWERGILFTAIGYPDPEGKVAFSAKKDLDLLRSYNRVGPLPTPREKGQRPGSEP